MFLSQISYSFTKKVLRHSREKQRDYTKISRDQLKNWLSFKSSNTTFSALQNFGRLESTSNFRQDDEQY